MELKLVETKQTGKAEGYITTFSIVVNPEVNGGESVTLFVDVFDNGNDGYITHTKIEVVCHGVTSASMSLGGVLPALSEATKLLAEGINGYMTKMVHPYCGGCGHNFFQEPKIPEYKAKAKAKSRLCGYCLEEGD